MDRERDRDAVEEMIEEHDEKVGGSEPDRKRPGQGDAGSTPIDGQRPPQTGGTPPEPKAPPSADPGPFAPH